MTATLEIFRVGRWRPAAVLTALDESRGLGGACQFEYLPEYAGEFAGPETSRAAGLSCRLPADFQLYELDNWPAFVLDLLPSGYGRRQWLEILKLQDGPASDWSLLLRGTAFPPGNLRVAEAVAAKDMNTKVPTSGGGATRMKDHPGFTRGEVVERHEAFVEYAFQHGIYAAGASDVQGVAPKLLLAQDQKGAWHAEGRLGDGEVASHWILKRPRGDHAADRTVLRNEAAYMRVARQLGLKVFAELEWQEDSLFVPRFDRTVQSGGVMRIGMESLNCAAGVAKYGARIAHELACEAIEAHCTDASTDLMEYVQRDIVNVVMGNKDNHGRNTALLRHESGRVELSPLFDFAPMYLDPEGIARVCRWSEDAETAGEPEWGKVIEKFAKHKSSLRTALLEFGHGLQRLPGIMRDCGVDDDVLNIAALPLNSTQSSYKHCRRQEMRARKSSATTKRELVEAIENNELSLGEAVRGMRMIAGMSQKDYAQRIVGIATRILAEVELDQGNPTLETLNKIGRPFGYGVGFVRRGGGQVLN